MVKIDTVSSSPRGEELIVWLGVGGRQAENEQTNWLSKQLKPVLSAMTKTGSRERIVTCEELGLTWAMRTSEEVDLRWRKSKS